MSNKAQGGEKNLTISNLIIYITGAAGILTALSVIYGKLIKPIKNLVDKIEKNRVSIESIDMDLETLSKELRDSNEYATENRAITMKSMIAILDGLEEQGCNGNVTKTKKELINYMAKNLNGKK